MTTITASKARTKLSMLLDQTTQTHKPIKIKGKRSNAVLVSEKHWRAVQETLYLLSVPGMRESLHKGLNTPVSKFHKKLKW